MLKIRLQRIGKRGQAYFKLVVTEHTVKPQGKYLDLLGSYDPHKKELIAKKDKIDSWLTKGAQLSATAHNLLINNGLLDAPKVTSWAPKAKPAEPVEIVATVEKKQVDLAESKETADEPAKTETQVADITGDDKVTEESKNVDQNVAEAGVDKQV